MGDAKDRSPKKILKCDMDLEMGDAKERSPKDTVMEDERNDLESCQEGEAERNSIYG